MGKCSNAFFSETTNMIDRKSKMAATAIHRLTLDPMGKCSNAFLSERELLLPDPLLFLFHTPRVCQVLISSPGPKVQVNYCHQLASVVCKLFTFQASSPKPLGRLEPNLAGMFLGWSFTKLLFFVPVGYSIWLPRPIICSDWLKFQRSSSLKLMN